MGAPATPGAKVVTLPKVRGGNLDLLRNHDHECIIVSPSDCGKTWAACLKTLILCTDKHRPGVHAALCRKVHSTMEQSVIRTFKTIAAGLPIRRSGGQWTEKFIFPNGSELISVGLDKPEKLLSSEWDFVQVCQTEELEEGDWEMIASRCTGRGAVVAYPQIFGDCNPSGINHWIRTRAKTGKLTLLTATHKDNPALYDDAGNLLPEGARRLKILDESLTGMRRRRLLLGQWATAEGAVYDMFNSLLNGPHVMARDPKEMVRWFLTMDEGYTNPAVILVVGEDSDGRWHVYREFYQRGVLQNAVVNQSREWWVEFACRQGACDESAAGLIADLNNVGVQVVGTKGRVLDGIAAIQNRLNLAGDGRARLTVEPTCVNLINEFESYVWEPEKDKPRKENDHAMDALRYLHALLYGDNMGSTPTQWADFLRSKMTAPGEVTVQNPFAAPPEERCPTCSTLLTAQPLLSGGTALICVPCGKRVKLMPAKA